MGLPFASDDGIVVVVGEGPGQKGRSAVSIRYGVRKKARAARMTIAEYLQTPETVLPHELAFGVLRVADAPRTRHQRVVLELLLVLAPFVRARQLGEVLPAPIDVILDADAALVVQPDLVFVSNDRHHIVGDRIDGAPDLAVEVLSPHPRIGSIEERVGWFARYGVRECWLVSLDERRIAVLSMDRGRVVDRVVFHDREPIRSAVLPDLTLTPFQVFGY